MARYYDIDEDQFYGGSDSSSTLSYGTDNGRAIIPSRRGQWLRALALLVVMAVVVPATFKLARKTSGTRVDSPDSVVIPDTAAPVVVRTEPPIPLPTYKPWELYSESPFSRPPRKPTSAPTLRRTETPLLDPSIQPTFSLTSLPTGQQSSSTLPLFTTGPTDTPTLGTTTEAPTTASPTVTVFSAYPTLQETSVHPTMAATTNPPTLQPTLLTDLPTPIPPVLSTSVPTVIQDTLSAIQQILTPFVQNPSALRNPFTPEAAAIQWMVEQGLVEPNRVMQRYALLTLDFAMQSRQRRLTAMMDQDRPAVHLTRQAPLFAGNGPDECTWTGVTCSPNGIVVSIKRPGLNLAGAIPNDIRLLRNLTHLDLGENQLHGTIPDGLYDCTNLRRLYLHDNRLSGTLSNKFSQLYELDSLFLSDNRFTGTFPNGLSSPERGPARPLRFLTIYNNSITGPLPTGTNWRNLFYFDVGRNLMTGTLPTDWWEGRNTLLRIRHLYLSHNRFSGTIPSQFTTMGNGRMNLVVINNNRFEGQFPGGWDPAWFLEVTEFQNNNFQTMSSDLCRMIVFNGGELTTMGVDCRICRCGGFLCRAPYCTEN